MKSTDIPTKFPIPFGNAAAAGTIRPIPTADQTATSPGAASLTTGFPVATGQPLASGGVPPAMQDFNGLFQQITAWNRWQAAGGLVPYDSAFSTAVGGYPAGAAVLSASVAGRVWISAADNNTTNPDAGGATNWLGIALLGDVSTTITNYQIAGGRYVTLTGSGTWTVPANAAPVIRVLMNGGGAGGGGCYTSGSFQAAGVGGGGGEYAEGTFAVTPGQQLAYSVGSGGTGGLGSSTPTVGSNGGTTSLGGLISAGGGTGGAAGLNGIASSGGTGGTGGSGGGRRQFGGGGGFGIFTSTTGTQGGQGGYSPFGGPGTSPNVNTNGTGGYGPGGGGAGGGATSASLSGNGNGGSNGGSGAAGIIVVQY